MPPSNSATGSCVLQSVQRVEALQVDVAVGSAEREPRAPEQPPVHSRRALVPSVAVAFHLVLGREGLDVGDPAQQTSHRGETAAYVALGEVLQHVRADDEIDVPRQTKARQLGHRALSDVALGAESPDHIIARVHANVPRAWPEPRQNRLPGRLATTYVEHGSD